MSRLYYSEEGRVMPSLCEELTIFRRARKTLTLARDERAGNSLYSRPPLSGKQRALASVSEWRGSRRAKTNATRILFMV